LKNKKKIEQTYTFFGQRRKEEKKKKMIIGDKSSIAHSYTSRHEEETWRHFQGHG
jgi:hypothetical protein